MLLPLVSLRNPFLNGLALRSPIVEPAPAPSSSSAVIVKAMRSLQGKVVCAASDKTVAVEVIRLAPHPKYKRRVKKKKTYQAHDPTNQFKVGDTVQLEKRRPISKTKTFWAIPAGRKPRPEKTLENEAAALDIPLEPVT